MMRAAIASTSKVRAVQMAAGIGTDHRVVASGDCASAAVKLLLQS
jgi:hypothetical protein